MSFRTSVVRAMPYIRVQSSPRLRPVKVDQKLVGTLCQTGKHTSCFMLKCSCGCHRQCGWK